MHALIEKWKNSDEDDRETFYSLVSINPETAEQTLVADFGSLGQALNDVSVGFYDDVKGQYLYDKTTHSLILSIVDDYDCCQLVRLDISNKKIIAGEKFNNNCITLFLKDSKVCGAFYNDNDDWNIVDFRLIDTEKLTAGELLGSATTESEFGSWVYDTATGKSYTAMYFEDSEAFGAFDFNTKEFDEIKEYPSSTYFELIFQ